MSKNATKCSESWLWNLASTELQVSKYSRCLWKQLQLTLLTNQFNRLRSPKVLRKSKWLLYTLMLHLLDKRKICLNQCLMLTTQSKLKRLGTVGGRVKNTSMLDLKTFKPKSLLLWLYLHQMSQAHYIWDTLLCSVSKTALPGGSVWVAMRRFGSLGVIMLVSQLNLLLKSNFGKRNARHATIWGEKSLSGLCGSGKRNMVEK